MYRTGTQGTLLTRRFRCYFFHPLAVQLDHFPMRHCEVECASPHKHWPAGINGLKFCCSDVQLLQLARRLGTVFSVHQLSSRAPLKALKGPTKVRIPNFGNVHMLLDVRIVALDTISCTVLYSTVFLLNKLLQKGGFNHSTLSSQTLQNKFR